MKKVFLTILFISAGVFLLKPESTLNIFKKDNVVLRFLMSGVDSLEINKGDNLMRVHQSEGIITDIKLSEIDSINYTTEEYSAPTVETVSAEFRSSLDKAVCEINVSDAGGCEILERGVCWSTSPNPTVKDQRSVSGTAPGKSYAIVQGLNQEETYYVRAYAVNCMGTSYGEEIKIQAFLGNVTYTLDVDPNQYPEYYSLLKTALDSACYYYSRYTAFEANIYVYYNAGIPTAQANYHGSIGFGSNTTYMWVGTAMHEMAHYFGSGTTSVWKSKMVNGVWQGEKAQALCQELTGQTLSGDGGTNAVHYWPTGINFRSEVSSEQDLINHAKVVQAMLVEDCGLPTSW